MVDQTKVLIVEKNGTELDAHEEMAFLPENMPFSTDGFTSDNVKSAVEEVKTYSQGFPRAGIVLVFNGTVGNNDWISFSSLTPDTPIVFAVKTKLEEFSWSNNVSNNGRSFDLEFYKNGITSNDLIYTYSVRDSENSYGYASGLEYTFNPGDYLRIKYVDQGLNCSDMNITLWVSRLP